MEEEQKLEIFNEQADRLADAILESCNKRFPYPLIYYAIILALLKHHSLSDYPLEKTLSVLKKFGEEMIEDFRKK